MASTQAKTENSAFEIESAQSGLGSIEVPVILAMLQ